MVLGPFPFVLFVRDLSARTSRKQQATKTTQAGCARSANQDRTTRTLDTALRHEDTHTNTQREKEGEREEWENKAVVTLTARATLCVCALVWTEERERERECVCVSETE